MAKLVSSTLQLYDTEPDTDLRDAFSFLKSKFHYLSLRNDSVQALH